MKATKDDAPGFLQRGKVRSAGGRANYTKGSEDFRAAARSYGWKLEPQKQLDLSLRKYVESLATDGGSLSVARTAVFGEAWRRGLNLHDSNVLYRARASLEGWAKLIPEGSKDPCPWVVAAALANDLLDHGGDVEREAAQCIAVQFETYTRPSVAIDLKTFNIVEPPSDVKSSYRQVGVVLAPKEQGKSTKTGHLDDSLLIGRLNKDRAFVAPLLLDLKRKAERGKRLALFPNLTLAVFQRKVRESAARLSLQKLNITPHLFRHGGPSTDVFEGLISLDEVRKRGHWHSLLSVKRYEKHTRLLKVLNALTADQRRRASDVAGKVGKRLLRSV